MPPPLAAPAALPAPLRWELFCRVIDNYGDVGVAWRLARALAALGDTVRLWIDDARALAWMAPGATEGAVPGVQVRPWHEAEAWAPGRAAPDPQPPGSPATADVVGDVVGDVVVETFGCALPEAFVAAMAARAAAGAAPAWINLEYLSAEPYVERSHGLRSPQFSGPGAGLDKWFVYPGFSAATAGLLQGLPPPADAAWLQQRGLVPLPGERRVLLWAYPSLPAEALLAALAPQAGQPVLLWLAPGGLADALQARLATRPLPAGLRVLPLPALPQPDFDRLIGAADLAVVRGEDSFVRAQLLPAATMLWQIYPQHDGVHAGKLAAWLDRLLADATPGLAAAVRAAHAVVNGLAPGPLVLPPAADWAALHAGWRARLLARPCLASQLRRFACDKLQTAPARG